MTMRVQHAGRPVGAQQATAPGAPGSAQQTSALILAATMASRAQGTASLVSATVASSGNAAAAAQSMGVLSDPTSLLMAMQARLRNNQSNVAEHEIKDASLRADDASRARMKALKEAEKAAEKASKFLGIFGGKLGKILGDVVKVVAIAAAAVATVATGGIAGALIAAGTVLLLTANKIGDEAVKLGIIDKKDEGTLVLGLQIAGAALCVAGNITSLVQAASSAASAASGGVNAAEESAQTSATLGQTIRECGQDRQRHRSRC